MSQQYISVGTVGNFSNSCLFFENSSKRLGYNQNTLGINDFDGNSMCQHHNNRCCSIFYKVYRWCGRSEHFCRHFSITFIQFVCSSSSHMLSFCDNTHDTKDTRDNCLGVHLVCYFVTMVIPCYRKRIVHDPIEVQMCFHYVFMNQTNFTQSVSEYKNLHRALLFLH